MIAWSVWTRRNKLQYKEPSLPPEKILDHTRSLLSKFQCKATAKPQKPNPVPIKWNPPNCEALKINYDGAIFADTFEAGIGVVISDGNGTVLAALPEKIAMPTSVELVEILAARRGSPFYSRTWLSASHIRRGLRTGLQSSFGGGSMSFTSWSSC